MEGIEKTELGRRIEELSFQVTYQLNQQIEAFKDKLLVGKVTSDWKLSTGPITYTNGGFECYCQLLHKTEPPDSLLSPEEIKKALSFRDFDGSTKLLFFRTVGDHDEKSMIFRAFLDMV